jgi:hypothetical protein
MLYLVRNVKIILIYLIFSGCSFKVLQPTATPKNKTLEDFRAPNNNDYSAIDINYIDPLLYFSSIILGIVLLIIILFFIKKIKT